MPDTSVTVVMNGFKRRYAAKEQYEAYRQQSTGTPQFLFWGNYCGHGEIDEHFDKYVVDGSKSAIANSNMGVWARFAFALNANTPYICVVDDDTIPGQKWLENCIDTIEELGDQAVLTTRGVRIKNNQYPMPDSYDAIGWCSANENIEQVDFGGHCWFFHKHMLKAFWMDAPDVLPLNYGEDIHLSFAAWNTANCNTYVPRHPIDKPELWGSVRETASKYGEDMNATSRSPQASQGMFQYFNWVLRRGYVPVVMRNNEQQVSTQQV